jgi:UDP-N-acetylglucosamine--N-acetylmuramyl-(pentapeptide) pyrophosphoryl-undecaprenol N-acetylglucosamine transferase
MFAAPHIVLACDGGYAQLLSVTALADALADRLPGAAITFLGSGRSLERHFVRERGYGYVAIPAAPHPQNPFEAVRFVAENFVGYWASRWILREQQVSIVIGCGGFASGIIARASVARGLPTVLLEQNVIPSRVARWLARSVTSICTSFSDTASLLPSSATIHLTGFPVPQGLLAVANSLPAALRTNENRQRRLIVLGGSAGAASLNYAVPAALGRLRRQLEGWHVVHQTGPGHLQRVEEQYGQVGVEALAVSFIDDLAHVLAETDLAVCRAGGATLSELSVAGVPAILVPHPGAPDDQQLANAQAYLTAGACRLVEERAGAGRLEEALSREIDALLIAASTRAEMATAIRTFSRPRAAQDVAEICAALLASGCDAAAA